MKHKKIESIYPYDDWRIIEEKFDINTNLRNETIFALGNGYIGMRGNFEEGYHGPVETSVNGIYLNGFYESEPIIYGEEAYGYAKNRQTMVNVAESRIIQLLIEDESFNMFTGKVMFYQRVLDMQKGVLTREVVWESPSGKQVKVKIIRMVSLSRQRLAVISYEVTPLNFAGKVTIVSAIDGEVRYGTKTGDPRTGSGFTENVLITEEMKLSDSFGALRQKTKKTRFALVCSMENHLDTNSEVHLSSGINGQKVEVKYEVAAKLGESIRLSKYISYYTSRDADEENLHQLGKQVVDEARKLGMNSLLEEQQTFLDRFWYRSDVEIQGDAALQQSIRFNIFHLLQSAGRDGKTNIGAKGLTGEGYEGHYFWDTETYILPFFLYTHPEISKKLLEYRYHTLDYARKRAKELSHKGALFPWRTINGEETSAYFPGGTAQYHINADIAHALRKYMDATDDTAFFLHQGAELLFETARLWADLGDYIVKKDGMRFCINNVTGPDEYTAIVNNNFYTNLMAQEHLKYAYDMAKWMQSYYPGEYGIIAQKIKLNEKETEEWIKAAELMYTPYHEELGIYPQDDSFLEKAVWDFVNTPEENYPLLLHYHPLVIYRYQVLKQADVVLASYLQGKRFTMAEKKRNYDYYEPITTHDSSLSPCIYSIMASEIGYRDKAYDYFKRTARMDLDDMNHNVKDGVHTAAMAGAWLSIFSGFAGIRDYEGQLFFNPFLPEPWEEYRFKVTYKNRLLEVNILKNHVIYRLLEGEPITVYHQNLPIELERNQKWKMSIKSKLEAVLFDLDGVVTDTAELHYQAWARLAKKIGVSFNRDINEKLKGIGRRESLRIILSGTDKNYTDQEELSLTKEKNEYYKQLVNQLTPDDLLPGVLPLLKELKQNGIKIGLASASENAFTVLERLQIQHYFDYIADARTIKKGKPDPEIFMTVADALKVPYQNCIGIEDAEAGILAIKAANIYAVGVGNREVLFKAGADWVIEGFTNIRFENVKKHFYV